MSYDIDAALTLHFGGVVSGQIFPNRLPDKPLFPAIVYTTPGTRPDSTLLGQSTLTFFRYRLDLYSMSRKELGQLRNTVLARMRRFAYQNIPVADFDGYEPTTGLFRRTIDFSISETLPKSSLAPRKPAHVPPST